MSEHAAWPKFFAPRLDALWARLGARPDPDLARFEHVYFDTGHPSLSFTGFLRARRAVAADGEPFAADARFHVEFRPAAQEPTWRHPEPVALADVPALAARRVGLAELHPLFGVRYERQRHALGPTQLDVDHDVTYWSLVGAAPCRLGSEPLPRVAARGKGRTALLALLGDLPRAPYTSKKWMGYAFVKALYELPRRNELPGFEYELKLDADCLDIDLARLPFPVVEVHQTESVRRYYRGFRACVRGEQAHIVEKGPVEELGAVWKRAEVKRRGVAPWELPDPLMVMRRYKREVNVLNPDSGRVYTLSLHHCDAGPTLQQLEIEYDGRLLPGAVGEMARFKRDHDPRRLLALGGRARVLGWPEVANGLWERCRGLGADAPAALAPEPPGPDAEVEAAVVDDMEMLGAALVAQRRFRPSARTKRKWLEAVRGRR